MMRIPVCILGFDRNEYISILLESLKEQTDQDFDVYLFQDGAVNRYSGRQATTDEKLESYRSTVRSVYPTCNVLSSPDNIGIAENMARAEEFAFEELKSDFVVFIEEDVQLSKHQIDVFRNTQYLFDDPRVGAFTNHGGAYGIGKVYPSLDEQEKNKTKICMNAGNRCYSVSRGSWVRYKENFKGYLDVVRGHDYGGGFRPNREIKIWHKQVLSKDRVRGGAGSQDWNRASAMARAGMAFVGTYVVYSKHIGVIGKNANKEVYERKKYGTAVFFDRPVYEFELDASILDVMIKRFV